MGYPKNAGWFIWKIQPQMDDGTMGYPHDYGNLQVDKTDNTAVWVKMGKSELLRLAFCPERDPTILKKREWFAAKQRNKFADGCSDFTPKL